MIDLSTILTEVKLAIENHTEHAFRVQKDPVSGASWSPLKPASLKVKRPNMRAKILQNTRAMRSGVHVQIEGNKVVTQIDQSNAEKYAPFHQLGTSKMPQRRFLPFGDQGVPSEALQRDIQEILTTGRGGEDLKRQIQEMLRGS
ncbi:phage virion morphogenesis protein [Helicobacter felis]|uniref:Phage virion morphogenesis protein n=1 Tax=Helicobacter felis (strain ATCC 49179 / CCUG 28539 / NCTC 12436 / CS1) TaxID=936155 RepID=E7AC47_HELFC|nr:phage virion morphogenesis protein [Helicobacter felis]CBY82129.1 phage virion morphogenesis protein [Helicobacter felis ATCC 49179]